MCPVRGQRWAFFVLLLMIIPLLTNCISPDSGEESGTELEIIDPDSYTCDPFDSDVVFDPEQGVEAELYYLSAGQPRYGSVADYIEYGHHVSDILLYFNQIYIPTRPFDRGFTTMGGQTIQSEAGDTLYEYFALRMRGRLKRGSLPEGNYQFAVLADDGAVLDMDFGSGLERVVDNDGVHPTRMGCATDPVYLDDNGLPFQLDYYQGPRYHIANVVLVRPWPTDDNWNDIECGRQGNSRYFDSTNNPPTPQPAYNAMLARGWVPLDVDNYQLPDEGQQNPCNEAAPVISNFQVVSFDNTTATFTWTTDVLATSMMEYNLFGDATLLQTSESTLFSGSHSVTVTGLTPNTTYEFRAESASTSGLSSQSASIILRTRR